MTRKEKGFCYIDSHSGAGMYQLADAYAQKTGEYKDGIAKIINDEDAPESLEPYLSLINSLNLSREASSEPHTDPSSEPSSELEVYPGSPGIAKAFVRRQDSSHLFELHPTDIQHLEDFCQRWRKVFVKQSDGYKGVLGLLPPPCRRGVVLIDPPYELKEDYQKSVKTIIKAYAKFSTGTYILWYPVVKRELVEQMQQAFKASAVKNVLQVEFCMAVDTDEYGMTGTGLFIVNPPWQLTAQLEEILPYMKAKLGTDATSYTLKQLITE